MCAVYLPFIEACLISDVEVGEEVWRVDLTRTGLLDLAEKRMVWLEHRQQVLAQNVANADTPGWQARDLRPFADVMADRTGVAPTRTQVLHLTGTRDPNTPPVTNLLVSSKSANGNAVAMEEQLTKVADTETTQAMVVNIYRKYLSLFRLAMGRAQ
jgi:flagellar basal-body rod protein FlgB